MVASNSKVFIGHRIFHKKSDVITHNLATISVLVIHLKKKRIIFDVLKKYIIIKFRGAFKNYSNIYDEAFL